MPSKLKTAVLGVTGYSGFELVRLLLRHPHLEKPVLVGRQGDSENPVNLADLFPKLSGNGGYPVKPLSWESLKQQGVELLFMATPHQVSRSIAPDAIANGLRVIDLSGAWRLKEQQHSAVYKFQDADMVTAAELTRRAVYGLPELNGDSIRSATLVANPGCYATSIILALAPLIKAGVIDRDRGIISDSKSGVSGAGKEPTSRTHFVSVADNLSAYSVFNHRHVGEILEQLGLNSPELTFTPHLLPIPRGILSTLYVHLRNEMKPAEVEAIFRDFYRDKHWVRVFSTPKLPEIQFSVQTNYCDLGFCLAEDGRRLVLVSCIDNLLKGAAGQAVQNMNLMYGWSEERRFAVKIVVKLGGAALEEASTLKKCAKAIVELAQDGHKVAVVHGGGSALTRTLELLGRKSTFINGLRITDAETRDVALMVLAGIVNKKLVAAITGAGNSAIGLCGGDGMTFRARKKNTPGCDLGFVGEIISSDPRWIEAIWAGRGIPVISSVALGSDGEYYNINADQIAAACAAACHADALIFLTDVAGVKNAEGAVIPWLSTKQVPAMIEESVIRGGMLPKLDACNQALKRGVGRVRIFPAAQAEVLSQFYFTRLDCGTEVTCA